MFIATASACAVTMVRLLHSCQKFLQEPPLTLPSSRKHLNQPPVKLPASPFRPSSIYLNSPTSKYDFFPMAARPLIINQNPSVAIIPPKTKDRSSRKVRILCRFGGKLMPRLSDGALHYVGGQTYETDFHRDTTLQDLYCKMEDIYGRPAAIRYKLSDQNLDTLVSVLSPQDLDNMLDEYDNLLEAPGGQYTRLEVFLFTPSDRENSLIKFNDMACNDNIEEVNGAATKDDTCRTYGEDNIEGSTRGDRKGNDSTLVQENESFPTNSDINEENYWDPEIVNLPYDDISYISPTYSELHQDLWNIPGPSNNASDFGHFRLTQDSGVNEEDENLQNLVEIVESVLQSS